MVQPIRLSGDIVRYSPHLKSWMLAYAEYLVSCPMLPSMGERKAELARLARRPFTARHVKLLEAREDFRKYIDELNQGPLAEARAKYLRRLPRYIEAHEQAMEMAMHAGDYKAVPAFTLPAIDRVAPKHGDVAAAVQVNVTVSPARLAAFTHYTPPVIEVQPDDLVPPGDPQLPAR